jgi:hypothetical protein
MANWMKRSPPRRARTFGIGQGKTDNFLDPGGALVGGLLKLGMQSVTQTSALRSEGRITFTHDAVQHCHAPFMSVIFPACSIHAHLRPTYYRTFALKRPSTIKNQAVCHHRSFNTFRCHNQRHVIVLETQADWKTDLKQRAAFMVQCHTNSMPPAHGRSGVPCVNVEDKGSVTQRRKNYQSLRSHFEFAAHVGYQ